ncbi:MAG: PfkB family carbohydrate kinase [Gemmataceae bacterium]
MSADLIELVQNLGQPRVLVVGDLMLDRYVWGDASRISQEAPVILLKADRKEERLGGASSVATMLRALGAKVSVAGVVGADSDALRVKQLLTELSINYEGVISDPDRPTTVKERYIGRAQHRHPQQMLRVDHEDASTVGYGIERELGRYIQRQVLQSDIVLVSDYDKGVCTPNLLAQVIANAKRNNLRILVDPIRGQDYRKYHGCSAITPNRLEASLGTELTLNNKEDVFRAGQQLVQDLGLEASLITLDKDGMAFVHQDGTEKIFPTRPRQVYDITGAGDMVLAMLGMVLASGRNYEEAIALANVAGGLEVEKIGVATVTRDEILQDLLHHGAGTQTDLVPSIVKVVSLKDLSQELRIRRTLGQRVGFASGDFDMLQVGHVNSFRAARAEVDVLIVGVSSDASDHHSKGHNPLVNSHEARVAVVSSLESVDYVVTFDDSSPWNLIEMIRPDVLVPRENAISTEAVEKEFVESYGGRVQPPVEVAYPATNLSGNLRAA